MKVPSVFVTAVVTAMLGLQAWTLNEVVNLKIAVAELKTVNHLAEK